MNHIINLMFDDLGLSRKFTGRQFWILNLQLYSRVFWSHVYLRLKQILLNLKFSVYLLNSLVIISDFFNYWEFLVFQFGDFFVESLLGSVNIIFKQKNMSFLFFYIHTLFFGNYILGRAFQHINAKFLISLINLGLGLIVQSFLWSRLFKHF